jgi:hypothetical protein
VSEETPLVVAGDVEHIGDASMIESAFREVGIAHRIVQHLASGYDVLIPHAWGTLYVERPRFEEARALVAQVRADQRMLAAEDSQEEEPPGPSEGLVLLTELDDPGDAHLLSAAMEGQRIPHRVVPVTPSGFGVAMPHAWGLLYVERARLTDARDLILAARQDELVLERKAGQPEASEAPMVFVAELEGLGEAHLASVALEAAGIPHRITVHQSSGLDLVMSHAWGMLYAPQTRLGEASGVLERVRADAPAMAALPEDAEPPRDDDGSSGSGTR